MCLTFMETLGSYILLVALNSKIYYCLYQATTLQSIMNAKLSRAYQDDSNNTPQPIFEFQVDFPLLCIKAYPGLS